MGTTNHMTSEDSAFTELDINISDMVRFGDGLVVRIEGCGIVILRCKTGED
jgi:hypothetical protein